MHQSQEHSQFTSFMVLLLPYMYIVYMHMCVCVCMHVFLFQHMSYCWGLLGSEATGSATINFHDSWALSRGVDA